jgi:hypothetical protein
MYYVLRSGPVALDKFLSNMGTDITNVEAEQEIQKRESKLGRSGLVILVISIMKQRKSPSY